MKTNVEQKQSLLIQPGLISYRDGPKGRIKILS